MIVFLNDVAICGHLNPVSPNTKLPWLVTIGDPIKVTLGSNWFNGGTLVITLGNVQTAIPSRLRVRLSGDPDYTAYTFEAKSKGEEWSSC